MTVNNGVQLAGAIVLVGLVTTIVAHKRSAKLATSIGRAFAGSMRAAMGN